MRLPSDERVRDFIALTLVQWGLDIPIEPGCDRVVAFLRLGGEGLDVVVERAGKGDPFRWYVYRSVEASPGSRVHGVSRRPCGSLVGVLGALRRLLDIDAGGRARVVA